MTEEKRPPTIEQQESPIYYCWKYWTSDGEIRQGCTPIQPNNNDAWPDLNDYGWVYIAVPIAIMFVVLFVNRIVCSNNASSNGSSRKKSIFAEERESDDESWAPQPRRLRQKSYAARELAYPESHEANNVGELATVVHMSQVGNLSAPSLTFSPKGNRPSVANRSAQYIIYPQSPQRPSEKRHSETAFSGRQAGPTLSKKEPNMLMPSFPNVTKEKMTLDAAPTTRAEEEDLSDGDRASDALLLNHQAANKQQPWF